MDGIEVRTYKVRKGAPFYAEVLSDPEGLSQAVPVAKPSWSGREFECEYSQNWSVPASCFSTAIFEY